MANKFKRIIKPSELVGGQMYIRVLVNALGQVLLEVVTVRGKVFKGSAVHNRKYRLNITYSSPHRFKHTVYLSDTLQQYTDNALATKSGALYRFSNELLTKLISMLDSPRSVLNLINNAVIDDYSFSQYERSWELHNLSRSARNQPSYFRTYKSR